VAFDPVRAYFEGRAASYRSAFRDPLSRWVRASETEAVAALLGDVTGRTVLELGSGDGHYARRLRDAGAAEVVAVDLSEGMVARLRAEGIPGLVGDVATVDLGRRFDRVLAAGVLEFVPDPPAVLRNAARHALPGARLVVLVPGVGLAGRAYRWWHARHGIPVRLFQPADLERAAAESGWLPENAREAGLFARVAAFRLGPGAAR
jgi:SAM-dependent methyltransferase